MKDGSICPSINGLIYPSSNDLLLKKGSHCTVHKTHFAYFKSQPYTSQKPSEIYAIIKEWRE